MNNGAHGYPFPGLILCLVSSRYREKGFLRIWPLAAQPQNKALRYERVSKTDLDRLNHSLHMKSPHDVSLSKQQTAKICKPTV